MKDWDKELFIRVPKDLFDDPFWNNRIFTKKEAFLDLYFLAHDSPNNKGAIVEINGYMVKVEVGEVPKGLRFYTNRWNWGSTKKVSNFLKGLEKLGYIKIKGNTPITVVKILGWIPRRKHEETQKKHEGNRSYTPVIQLENKDNNKINNNKESGNDSLLSFDEYEKQFPDKNVNKSLGKYLDYTNNPSHKGAIEWLTNEKEKKKPQFRKTPTGLLIAYCSKCGNQEFPNDEWQLKRGSECHKVEYVLEKPGENVGVTNP
jgi:hypothetical protein